MAYSDLLARTSVSCTTPGAMLFAIKEHLKLAGWVTDGSGDGLALVSITGVDHITTGSSGAGGYQNANAWWSGHFGAAGPNRRHLMMQLITTTTGLATTDSQVSVEYIRNTGFTYTSATASIAPTGGEYMLGGAGSGQQFCEWTTNPMYVMGAADQGGVGAFWFAAWESGSNTSTGMGFMMEEVVGTDPDDPDPVVWYHSGGNNAASPSGFSKVMATDGSNPATALCRAVYNGVLRPAAAQAYESSSNELMVDVTSYPASPYDGKYMCQKMGFGTNQTALRAWKGRAKSVAFYPRSDSVGTARRNLFTHLSSNDYIRVINSLLPWDGSIPSSPYAFVNDGEIRFTDDGAGATPEITDPDPLPGDFTSDRESARLTAVGFVYTRGNADATPSIYVRLGSDIYQVYGPDCDDGGEGFAPMFFDRSTVTVDGNEYTFSLLPGGGWWGDPEISAGDFVMATVV